MIIPTALHKVMKEKLHHGHIGIQRTRDCARQVMFWPALDAEITDMISKCSACIENQAYQQKERLIFHEIPTEPWFKVGMDLFSFRNKSYLVVVGYYSNYIEVCHLYHQTKSPDVISHVKAIFACFGIPRVVISDNGPQFSSTDFKNFAKSWDFEHKTSSPDYPKANGTAESAVKAVKRIFKKAYKMNEDPSLALLALRSHQAQMIFYHQHRNYSKEFYAHHCLIFDHMYHTKIHQFNYPQNLTRSYAGNRKNTTIGQPRSYLKFQMMLLLEFITKTLGQPKQKC